MTNGDIIEALQKQYFDLEDELGSWERAILKFVDEEEPAVTLLVEFRKCAESMGMVKKQLEMIRHNRN